MNDFSDEIFSCGADKLPLFVRMYYFESGFNDDEINTIKKIAEKYATDEGQVVDPTGKNYSNPQMRSSSIKRLSGSDAELAWVSERLMRIATDANTSLRWNFSIVGFYEMLQLAKYDSEQAGHYGQHYDIGSGVEGIGFRKISVSVQLSDESEYEGGELEVIGFKAAPKKKGGVIVFPSFLMHRVAPVTKGVRESLVGWVAGPPFK